MLQIIFILLDLYWWWYLLGTLWKSFNYVILFLTIELQKTKWQGHYGGDYNKGLKQGHYSGDYNKRFQHQSTKIFLKNRDIMEEFLNYVNIIFLTIVLQKT